MSKKSTVVVLLILFSGILGTEMLCAQPAGGPLGFLQRLDANGNGMLEPDEQGRARPFIERIARDVGGIDMNRPIRLSTLGEKIQQMQGGQGDSSRGSSSRGSSSRGSSSRGSSGPKDMQGNPLPAEAALDSLVPGFDVVEDVIPVPGFGAKAEYLNVPVKEEDFTEAEQTIKRYDRNRNGILEADEIRNGRWRDDPSKQDRNGDGKLTRSELAVRYSLRRTSEAQRQAQSSGSSGGNSGGSQDRSADSRSSGGSSRFGGGSSRSSGGSSRFGGGGSSGADRMAQFAGSIMERYDANKSGVIEKSEYKNFRTDPSAADTNKDGKITKDELSKWMTSRFSQGGGRGGDSSSSRGGSGGSSQDADGGGGGADYVGSGSYRFKLPQEGLPEGLPGWYVTSDKNSDGQIAMSEFTGKWDAKTLAEYYAYDVNRDGVITPGEALDTTKSGFVRGVSSPRSSTGQSRSGSNSKDSSNSSKGAPATTSAPDEKYIRFAVSQINKYDENKNGMLDGGEVEVSTQKSSMIKASADSNGDGKITPTELATALSNR